MGDMSFSTEEILGLTEEGQLEVYKAVVGKVRSMESRPSSFEASLLEDNDVPCGTLLF